MPGLYYLPTAGPHGANQYPKALQQLLQDHPSEHCRFMGSSVGNHRTDGHYILCEQREIPSATEDNGAIDAQSLTIP